MHAQGAQYLALLVPPSVLVIVGVLLTLCSLPYWLPSRVVRLRERLFVLINGEGGAVEVPSPHLGAAATRSLYSSPHAKLRSNHGNKLGLSDLFWYLLMPGADLHQEHTESGSGLHTQVSAATAALLAIPTAELEAVAASAVAQRFADWDGDAIAGHHQWQIVRLREWLFPLVTTFWFEVCFGRGGDSKYDQRCISTLCASGSDVIDALKALKLRDMAVRHAATATVEELLAARPACRAAMAYTTADMSSTERALALQGVVFHTGCVQLADALTHLLLGLAQHGVHPTAPAAPTPSWEAVAAEGGAGAAAGGRDAGGAAGTSTFLGRALTESLRRWPLFGIAHRITDSDIVLRADSPAGPGGVVEAGDVGGGETQTIPAGTVLCFNYSSYHGDPTAYAHPNEFDPARWETLAPRECPYMPFGAPKNRPCPAQRVCMIVLPVFAQAIARGCAVWANGEHSRSLPGRGLCVMERRGSDVEGHAGERGSRDGAPGEGLRRRNPTAPTPSVTPQPVVVVVAPPSLATRPTLRAGLLLYLRLRALVDDVVISATQLVLGTVLVLAARRAALALRYHQHGVTTRGTPVPASFK